MRIYLIIRVCANRKNLDTPLEFLVFRSPILDAPSSSEMGTEWKRPCVTFKADMPQDGFWPNPHYLQVNSGHK